MWVQPRCSGSSGGSCEINNMVLFARHQNAFQGQRMVVECPKWFSGLRQQHTHPDVGKTVALGPAKNARS